jgi:hypothetical protein
MHAAKANVAVGGTGNSPQAICAIDMSLNSCGGKEGEKRLIMNKSAAAAAAAAAATCTGSGSNNTSECTAAHCKCLLSPQIHTPPLELNAAL